MYDEQYDEFYYEDEHYESDCQERVEDIREAFKGIDNEQI